MSFGTASRLAGTMLASNFGRLRTPYKLTFALTYKCNSRCASCNTWKQKSAGELSPEEIDAFFADNPRFQWVDLTGGEIVLRNDLPEIIESLVSRCRRYLYSLHFPTNGLLTEKVVALVDRVARLGVPQFIVTVSIDGPPETHDRLRGVPGGFDKAVNTLRALLEMKGVRTYAGMTLSRENAELMDETVAAIRGKIPRFAHSDLHVNIAHSSPHFYHTTDAADHGDHIRAAMQQFMKSRKVSLLDPVSIMEYQYLKRVPSFLATGKTPMKCSALSTSVFIDPTGNVYPCTIYDKKVGNIKERSLRTIWADYETKVLAEEIRGFHCPQCWTPCEAYQAIIANRFGLL